MRAGRFIVLGIFISVLSYFFAPQQPHYYGILMFLGIAIAALTPVLWWFKKAPASCGLILSSIGYELTRHLSNQVIMWQGKIIANLPDWLYGSWNAWLGMPPKDFISINYVPVLPNIFLFLVGLYLLRFLQEHQAGQKYLKISNNKSLAYLSSSSLLIYLLQQPLIFLGLEIKKFYDRKSNAPLFLACKAKNSPSLNTSSEKDYFIFCLFTERHVLKISSRLQTC